MAKKIAIELGLELPEIFQKKLLVNAGTLE
jgi:hypothetical protein